ncbi:MAG: MBL fold metallo-hydrolase [Treponema sp.]|nr:MBL fold metallo-hydrolase [Treponema sp.]
MKLFFHYCSYGFGNCYVLGAQEKGVNQHNVAIMVDPGSIDNNTLKTIEDNNFDLKAVLITHDHKSHVQGLRTLKRIYNAEVIAVNQSIMDHKTTMVKDGDKLIIGEFTIEVISIPGHSSDSVVYKIDNLLFTGDVLTAGLVGSTASAYGTATQMNKLRSRLLSLPGDYSVLPGHGPPSTLEAERRFNMDIYKYDQSRTRRPVFRVDL